MEQFPHHAYLIEGDIEQSVLWLKDVLKKQGVEVTGNPNVWIDSDETCTIDRARRLKDIQSRKAVSGSDKYLIVGFSFITREAQNSLLKVLEDPTDKTHIFLVAPSRSTFLQTLLSRLAVVEGKKFEEGHTEAQVFLESDVAHRMKMIEPIIKKESSKTEAFALISHVEMFLNKDVISNAPKLERILTIKQTLSKPSASVKMLLEELIYSV